MKLGKITNNYHIMIFKLTSIKENQSNKEKEALNIITRKKPHLYIT